MFNHGMMWRFQVTARARFWILSSIVCIVFPANAFVSITKFIRIDSRMYYIPLRHFQNDLNYLTSSDDDYRSCFDRNGVFHTDDTTINKRSCFVLGIAEEKDLPDVARFIVRTFGSDSINLSQDINGFERLLMQPAIEVVNGYSGIVAFVEVLSGLRSRLKLRFIPNAQTMISPPNLTYLTMKEKEVVASGSSIVLAVWKDHPDNDENLNSEIIASAELRLQPCDAKIPFTLPWLDTIERALASVSIAGFRSDVTNDLEPYLSNLCVDESYRGRGIGRALVRCVEDIAVTAWGYTKIYLHVDIESSALSLYTKEGYSDAGRRWTMWWNKFGDSSKIGYLVKKISQRKIS